MVLVFPTFSASKTAVWWLPCPRNTSIEQTSFVFCLSTLYFLRTLCVGARTRPGAHPLAVAMGVGRSTCGRMSCTSIPSACFIPHHPRGRREKVVLGCFIARYIHPRMNELPNSSPFLSSG